MHLEPPPSHPTNEELGTYLVQMHSCIETNFQVAKVAREKIKRRITWDGSFNVVATGALIFGLLGSVVAVSRWTSRVDERLSQIAQVLPVSERQTAEIQSLQEAVRDLVERAKP